MSEQPVNEKKGSQNTASAGEAKSSQDLQKQIAEATEELILEPIPEQPWVFTLSLIPRPLPLFFRKP